jgi:nucleotide-binding universal stress UspA family protein
MQAGNLAHKITSRAKQELDFRTVMFATDFSSACDNAWPYALALAKRYRLKLLLAHVIAPSIYASVPSGLRKTAEENARVEAESKMRHLQLLHGGTSDLDCLVLLREGSVADELLRLINERSVDILVAGTRGHRNLQRLLLGSVAEKLFRQASCPVLVVPEKARMGADEMHAIHRIICPTDFTSESLVAVAYATSLARCYEAQLILLHVVDDERISSIAEKKALRLQMESRLRQLANQHHLPSDLRFEVGFGTNVAESISRTAAEYQCDLAVLAVHEGDAVVAHQEERTLYRVIQWAHYPVLTVPTDSRI